MPACDRNLVVTKAAFLLGAAKEMAAAQAETKRLNSGSLKQSKEQAIIVANSKGRNQAERICSNLQLKEFATYY
jgi:hypothetical protein